MVKFLSLKLRENYVRQFLIVIMVVVGFLMLLDLMKILTLALMLVMVVNILLLVVQPVMMKFMEVLMMLF